MFLRQHGGRGHELGTQMGRSRPVKSIPAVAKLEDRHGLHRWHGHSAREGGIPILIKCNHEDLSLDPGTPPSKSPPRAFFGTSTP